MSLGAALAGAIVVGDAMWVLRIEAEDNHSEIGRIRESVCGEWPPGERERALLMLVTVTE